MFGAHQVHVHQPLNCRCPQSRLVQRPIAPLGAQWASCLPSVRSSPGDDGKAIDRDLASDLQRKVTHQYVFEHISDWRHGR
jgi:hypothetical protein